MNLNERYIELLRKSLINDLYIENEAKLIYLIKCFHQGQPPNAQYLVYPETLDELLNVLRESKSTGGTITFEIPDKDGNVRKEPGLRNFLEFAHTMIGRKRMENLQYCMEKILADQVPGDFIETGVWRGGATVFMRGILAAHGIEDRKVWVADSFEGLPAPSLHQDEGVDLSKAKFPVLAVSLEQVQELFSRYDLLDDQVVFVKGWFKDTLPSAPIDKLSLLRLDGDLYESTLDALNSLYDKVSKGGFIIVDDFYALPQCKLAIEDFRKERGLNEEIVQIDDAAVYWQKLGD